MTYNTRQVKKFNKQITKFASTLVPAKAVLFHKKMILLALRGFVQKPPVYTGRARGNWQVTINEVTDSLVEVYHNKKPLTKLQGDPLTNPDLSGLPPYSIAYITNNVDYLTYLDEGRSPQSDSMVSATLAELSMMFEK